MNERVLYGLLIQSRKSEPVRILLQKQLVELALLDSTAPRTVSQICRKISDIMQLNTLYQEDRALEGIQKACEYGTVDQIGESVFQLTELGRSNLRRQAEEAKEAENGFDECLLASIPKGVAPLDKRKALLEAVKQDLVSMMEAKASSLTASIVSGNTLLNQSELDGHGFPVLEALLAKTCLSELEKVDVLLSVRDALLQGNKFVSSYVTSLYRRTFYYKMLVLDPGFQRLQIESIAKWTLYLDTNVIFALLLPNHRLHDSVVATLKKCATVGCTLRVSSVTLAEFGGQVRLASILYARYTSGDGRTPIDMSLTSNKFIWHYVLNHRRTMDFDTYLRQYEHLEQILTRDYSICVDDRAHEVVQEDLEKLKTQVLEAKRNYGMSMAERTIEHDARNLMMIASLRQSDYSDDPDRKIWLLTLDRSLRRVRLTCEAAAPRELPRDLRFDEFIELMSVLAAPDFTGIPDEQYARLLLSSAIGILSPDISEVVGEFIDDIVESGMAIKSLLPERQDAVLRSLALDREAHLLVDRYKATTDEENRRSIEVQMDALVEKHRAQVEQRASDNSRIDNLSERVVEQRRELDSLHERLAELTSRYDQERKTAGRLRVAVGVAVAISVVLLVFLCSRL